MRLLANMPAPNYLLERLRPTQSSGASRGLKQPGCPFLSFESFGRGSLGKVFVAFGELLNGCTFAAEQRGGAALRHLEASE